MIKLEGRCTGKTQKASETIRMIKLEGQCTEKTQKASETIRMIKLEGRCTAKTQKASETIRMSSSKKTRSARISSGSNVTGSEGSRNVQSRMIKLKGRCKGTTHNAPNTRGGKTFTDVPSLKKKVSETKLRRRNATSYKKNAIKTALSHASSNNQHMSDKNNEKKQKLNTNQYDDRNNAEKEPPSLSLTANHIKILQSDIKEKIKLLSLEAEVHLEKKNLTQASLKCCKIMDLLEQYEKLSSANQDEEDNLNETGMQTNILPECHTYNCGHEDQTRSDNCNVKKKSFGFIASSADQIEIHSILKSRTKSARESHVPSMSTNLNDDDTLLASNRRRKSSTTYGLPVNSSTVNQITSLLALDCHNAEKQHVGANRFGYAQSSGPTKIDKQGLFPMISDFFNCGQLENALETRDVGKGNADIILEAAGSSATRVDPVKRAYLHETPVELFHEINLML